MRMQNKKNIYVCQTQEERSLGGLKALMKKTPGLDFVCLFGMDPKHGC